MAYTHHERWDGTGYPQGLAGAAIPLSGRLMAIADVYDALISRRVYKPAMIHSEAVKIIVSESGSHFDPELVQAFNAVADRFAGIAKTWADAE
jgi:putative two-component system response regulator